MCNQQQLTKLQEDLNRYASLSAADKKQARENKHIDYNKDASRFTFGGKVTLSFDEWCEFMRNTMGYNVSHAEIKQRLDVSDGWINNNIKPVVRWFRAKATREKGESSVFYNRDDLNNYLLNGCNFAMRTVLINLEDPRYGYDPEIIKDITEYKNLTAKRIRPHSDEYSDYIDLRCKLSSTIPEFINAADCSTRCPAVDISIEKFNIPDLWSCRFHTLNDMEENNDQEIDNTGKRKYTGTEMFERAMYSDGCIRIALSGYDSNRNCKKKVYIDYPIPEGIDRSKLVRVSLQDFETRGHKLERLNIVKLNTAQQNHQVPIEEVPPQVESETIADAIDPFGNLAPEHKESIDAFLSGKQKNLFITGGAGSGKTFLAKAIIKKLKADNKNVLLCAPTAIAALNMDDKYGRTLHSVFNINHNDVIPYATTGNPKVPESIINADVIVIDEISMVRMDTFKYVIKTIEAAEQILNDKLNSQDSSNVAVTKQCLFVGDFFQLSPVVSKKDAAELVANGWSAKALDRGAFCFFTEEWQNRITKENFIELNKTYRQSNEEYITMLNVLRKANDIDTKIKLRKWLNKFARAYPQKEKLIHLCSTNKLAAAINEANLNKLPGAFRKYEPISYPIGTKEEIEWDPETAKDTPFQVTLEGKIQTSLVQKEFYYYHDLYLKVGAKIVMTVNHGKKFSNGQQGIIYKLYNDTILVRFLKDGKYGKPVEIKRHKYYSWEYRLPEDVCEGFQGLEESDPILCATVVEQFPLRVAYAISIHKSQGMTLDGVCIHPQVFNPGELYVAFSRVKDPANLYLSEKVSRRYIMTSFDVLRLYNPDEGKFPKPYPEIEYYNDLVDKLDNIIKKITDTHSMLQKQRAKCAFETVATLEDVNVDLEILRKELIKLGVLTNTVSRF